MVLVRVSSPIVYETLPSRRRGPPLYYPDLLETPSSRRRDKDVGLPTAPGCVLEDTRRRARTRRRQRTLGQPSGTARPPTPKHSSPSHEEPCQVRKEYRTSGLHPP